MYGTNNNQRLIRITGILLAIAIFASAFIWLDFHLTKNWTHADATVETYALGMKDTSNTLPQGQRLALYVSESNLAGDQLRRHIADQLKEELVSSPFIAQVEVVEDPPVNPEEYGLIVELEPVSGFWTPVFARADLDVNVFFASDGDLSWYNKTDVVQQLQVSPSMRLKANYQFEDTYAGLLTRAAFQHQLAEKIAEKTADTMLEAFSDPTKPVTLQ